MNNKENIIKRFKDIKSLGFVKSNRRSNTGIGKTFEDYMGIVENNLNEPDLFGYEIKSHREESTSYVTLFTKSPDFPRKANNFLNTNFGTPYEDNSNLNRLHTSLFANKFNSLNDKYAFKLINDAQNRTIRIGIFDLNTKQCINNDVGYTYDEIETNLRNKLKNLFYVSAKREFRDNNEYFFFNKAEIYTNPSLARFLDLLNKGLIMFDIRIGSYKSGNNIGRTHDHGSAFRIINSNIKLLYENRETIE